MGSAGPRMTACFVCAAAEAADRARPAGMSSTGVAALVSMAVCGFSCFDRWLRAILQVPLQQLGAVQNLLHFQHSRAVSGHVVARSSVE